MQRAIRRTAVVGARSTRSSHQGVRLVEKSATRRFVSNDARAAEGARTRSSFAGRDRHGWQQVVITVGGLVGAATIAQTWRTEGVHNDAAADGAETVVGKVIESEKKEETAFNPETGEINWDCPCLGGMAHGPCGDEFKQAFSCFIYSQEEQKGIDCLEQFKAMQNCFREHPDVYGEEIADDEDASSENAQSAHESGVAATRSGERPPSPKTETGDISLSQEEVDQAGTGKPKKSGSQGNRNKQEEAKARFENEGKTKTRGGPHVDSQAAKAGASQTLNHAKHQGDIDVHEEHDAGGRPQFRKGVGS